MFRVGTELDIFITVVESQGSVLLLWAQTDFDAWQELSGLLESFGGDTGKVDIADVKKGVIYLAKYQEEDGWYRAQVISHETGDANVTVSFIDFGNTEVVPITDIAAAPSKMFDIPAQAQRFIIANVEPADGKAWSKDEVAYLKANMENMKYTCTIVSESGAGWPPSIQLFSEGCRTDLFDEFVSNGVGRKIPPRADLVVIPCQVLNVGQIHKVLLSHPESSIQFWVQPFCSQESLAALKEKMVNSHPVLQVTAGMACVVKYKGEYCRAVVTATDEEKDQCSVQFVDYGWSDLISISSVLSLGEELARIPAQAIPCCLLGQDAMNTDIANTEKQGVQHVKVRSILSSGVHVVTFVDEGLSKKEGTQDGISHNQKLSGVAKGYQTVHLDISSVLQVCISHIGKMGEFHCQLMSNCKLIDNMMVQLQSTRLIPIVDLTDGMACIVKSMKDNIYYRGLVQHYSLQQVLVELVDFGDTEVTSHDQVFQLPDELAIIPQQSFPFKLAGLSDDKVVPLLHSYDISMPLIAVILKETPSAYIVELIDTSSDRDVRLSACASSNNMMQTGQVAQKQSAKMSHNKMMIPEASVQVGCNEKLVVTAVRSGSEFFGQLAKYSQDELVLFQEKLTAYFSQHAVPMIKDPQIGDMCCTTYSEDGFYYRGVIQRCGDKLDVMFVDYGNSELKSQADVKELPAEFCKMPKQGISCHLIGSTHLSKPALEEALLDAEITVTIKEKIGDSYEVMIHGSNLFNSPQQSTIQYKETVLSAGTRDDVLIVHVENPAQFYCQLVKNQQALDSLMEQLETYGTNTKVNFQKTDIGTPVIARYTADDCWYRALVTGVRTNGEVEVVFVDYGNCETLKTDRILPVCPQFLDLPCQAICCCLADVCCKSGKVWPQEAIAIFKTLVEEATLTMHVKECNPKIKSHTVELYLDQVCINSTFSQTASCYVGRPTAPLQSGNSATINRPAGNTWARNFGVSSEKGHAFHSDTPQEKRKERFGAREQGPESVWRRKADGRAQHELADGWRDRMKQQDASHYKPTQVGFGSGNSAIPTFPKLCIPENQPFNVYVSFAVSPDQFWCQLNSSAPVLEKLMHEMNAEYNALGPNDLVNSHISKLQICCAKYSEDGGWYRAKVVNLEGELVTVYFVDYGNTDQVKKSEVKYLKENYLGLPFQAFSCSLAGARPVGEDWSEEAITLFQDLTIDKLLSAFMVEKQSDKYIIKLKDQSTYIHEALIKASWANAVEYSGDELIRRQHRRPSSSGSSQGSISNRSSQLEGHQVKYIVWPNNKHLDVNVVLVNSPAEFWCQLTENTGKIQQLMDSIEARYGSITDRELVIEHPEPGLPCCARYSEDGQWYRAVIKETKPGMVKVSFIDYGNEEWLESGYVKELEPRFLSLKAQAIKCQLYGIDPVGQTWNKEILEMFESLTAEKNLVAKLISRSGLMHHVRLIAPTDAGDVAVGEELIRLGLAVNSTEKVFKVQKLEVGTCHAVLPSWVYSSQDFFVQLDSCTDALSELIEEMFEFYQTLKMNDLALLDPHVGQACVAYHADDGNWFRSTLLKLNGNEVLVMYVDFGTKAKVPLSKVKEITAEFLELPQQAVRCSLDKLKVVDEKWSLEAKNYFKKVMQNPVDCILLSEKDGIFMVDLKEKNGVSVASQINSLCQENNPQHNIPKGISVSNRLGYPYRSCPSGTVAVYVSYVSSPSSFAVQLAKEIDDLQQFLEFINSETSTSILESPTVGAPCCAKYSKDGLWYRALINGISDDKADVYFVDYGNSDTVPLSDLRKITAKIISKVPFAISCKLAGTKEPHSDWSLSDIEKFEELIMEKELQATFAKRGSVYEVILRDGDIDVSKELFGSAPSGSVVSSIQHFPAVDIPTNTTSVFISHVNSPNDFYVNVASKASKLDAITEELAIFTGDSKLDNPLPGQACAAVFSDDKQWYRAVIKGLAPSGTAYEVQFIDYGNTGITESNLIAALPKHMLSVGPLAVNCSLDGIDEPSTGWPDSIVESLLEIGEDGTKQLEATFLTTTEPCRVKLMADEMNINEEIKAIVRPEQNVMSKQSKSQQLIHVEEHLPPAPELKTGKHQIMVIHVESLREFYIQLARDSVEIEQLVDAVDTKYGCMGDNELRVDEVKLGMLCCAKYSGNGLWHRANLYAQTGEEFEVHFVDFGNKDTVPASSLKHLTDNFRKIPSKLYKCCLYGTSNSVSYDDDLNSRLLNLTQNKIITAEVKSVSEDPEKPTAVILWDKDECINIAILGDLYVNVPLEDNGTQGSCKLNETDDQKSTDANETDSETKENLDSSELNQTTGKSSALLVHSTDIQTENGNCPLEKNAPEEQNDDELNNTVISEEISKDSKSVEQFTDSGSQQLEIDSINENTEQAAKQVSHQESDDVSGCDKPQTSSDIKSDNNVDRPTASEASDICQSSAGACSLVKESYYETSTASEPDDQFALESSFNIELTEESQVENESSFSIVSMKRINSLGLLDNKDDEASSDSRKFDDSTNVSVLEGEANEEEANRNDETIFAKSVNERKLLPGETYNVFLSHVDNPGHIWCQVDAEQYDHLMEAMAEYYRHHDFTCDKKWSAGDICCLMASGDSDERCYRVKIQSCTDEKALVHFLDVGTTQDTDLKNLKPLLERFGEAEQFVIQCSLHGVKPLEERWTNEATETLADESHCPLVMQVINNNPGCLPEVVLSSRNGLSFADLLINKSLALKSQVVE